MPAWLLFVFADRKGLACHSTPLELSEEGLKLAWVESDSQKEGLWIAVRKHCSMTCYSMLHLRKQSICSSSSNMPASCAVLSCDRAGCGRCAEADNGDIPHPSKIANRMCVQKD